VSDGNRVVSGLDLAAVGEGSGLSQRIINSANIAAVPVSGHADVRARWWSAFKVSAVDQAAEIVALSSFIVAVSRCRSANDVNTFANSRAAASLAAIRIIGW